MEMECIKKRNLYVLFISFIVIAINLIIIVILCPVHNRCGSALQEFKIKSPVLNSVTNFVMGDLYKTSEQRKRVMILELNTTQEDTIEFIYSFYERDCRGDYSKIFNSLLGIYNKRVLGFIHKKNSDIILLSNVSYLENVKYRFGNLIEPMTTTKFFDYIYYGQIYYHWTVGCMFEPMRYHFKYYKGKVYLPKGYPGMDLYEMRN